jgi:hypothetical protein
MVANPKSDKPMIEYKDWAAIFPPNPGETSEAHGRRYMAFVGGRSEGGGRAALAGAGGGGNVAGNQTPQPTQNVRGLFTDEAGQTQLLEPWNRLMGLRRSMQQESQ